MKTDLQHWNSSLLRFGGFDLEACVRNTPCANDFNLRRRHATSASQKWSAGSFAMPSGMRAHRFTSINGDYVLDHPWVNELPIWKTVTQRSG
jgi:hypothetical protein